MKTKRILSALLALLTVSTVFAGCASGNDSTSSDTKAASNGNASAVTENASETAEYTSPGVNYDGRSFRYMDYVTDDYFWQAATYSDVFADKENGDVINDAQYERNMTVEEELNIKLNVHSVANINRNSSGPEFKRLVLAGEDLIDVGFMFFGEMKSIFKEPSMYINMYDISTLDTDASWWDSLFVDTFTIYDKLPSLAGDINLYNCFAPIMIFFSKQLVEDRSLGNLYELVHDQAWTSDKLLEMSAKVANDLNGDGKMGIEDSYGMALQTNGITNFLIHSGGTLVERNGDEFVPSLNTERNIRILERYIPYIADTSMNANSNTFAGAYSNVFYELFIPMFQDNRILFYNNQMLIALELRAMESDFGVLPFPKFDELQDDYKTAVASSWATALMIPATNPDLDFTGNVLDALGYYSQQYVTPAYIDKTVMGKAIRDDESAEMVEIVLNSRTYEIAYFYGWGGVASMLTGLASSNSTAIASQYASIESKFLSDIETTMEQLRS